MTNQIHEQVRERYAAAAIQAASGTSACCGPEEGIGAGLYSALEQAELPDAAVLASLGCGNPTAVAELRPGERVLDEDDLQRIWLLRKAVHDLNSAEAMELLIDKVGKYKTNKDFLDNLNQM